MVSVVSDKACNTGTRNHAFQISEQRKPSRLSLLVDKYDGFMRAVSLAIHSRAKRQSFVEWGDAMVLRQQ
jgi:hypothetical protein